MNKHHLEAIQNPCRFAFETMQARFFFLDGDCTVMLTVNSGWE